MDALILLALAGTTAVGVVAVRRCRALSRRRDELLAERGRLVAECARLAASGDRVGGVRAATASALLARVGSALVEDAEAILRAPCSSDLEAVTSASGAAHLGRWGERLVEEARDLAAVARWLDGGGDAPAASPHDLGGPTT